VVRGEEPAMFDMLGYLEHRFSPPGEVRLVIAATRHEEGTFADPQALEYHQQRGRLLRSLTEADGVRRVEFSGDVDAAYACETGYAVIDIPATIATFGASIASMVSLWLSTRPRKERDSVPGVRLELPGKTLIISAEIPGDERRGLVEAFLNSGPDEPAGQAPDRQAGRGRR
jgi:hypothetical protein